MRVLFIYLFCMFICINYVYANEEKKVIPPDRNWERTNERDNSSPELYQGYKKDICDVIYGRDCPTGSGETNIPPTVIDQEVINYLYFNMGWGGESNGFYLADTFASWDFNTGIGIIHNIQPSN